MNCPSSVELTGVVVADGVIVAALVGFVAHGILRPLLEARGVSPWTLKDTLGSTPLVLLGSAAIGGAAGGGAALATCSAPWWVIGLLVLTIIIGVVTAKLGLIALKKVV